MARTATKWTWEVKSYIIDCYAGVESTTTVTGVVKPVRQFLWADADGEVWLGNSAAFAEHLVERFAPTFTAARYDYVTINDVLLQAGERIVPALERGKSDNPQGQLPLQPKKERQS